MAATATDLERLDARELVAHALERHHPGIALACSFQKEESVLLDMLLSEQPEARVFTIDTGVLFPETLATWKAIEDRYGVSVEVFDARSADGVAWTADRCCSDMKVAALNSALAGLDAWITGLRREQAPTRAEVSKVAYDEARGVVKYSPLVDWDEKAVWRYIHEHDLPYNPLHDRGYASIGCAPCTQPGAGREGRWAGSDKTECGIHVEQAIAEEPA